MYIVTVNKQEIARLHIDDSIASIRFHDLVGTIVDSLMDENDAHTEEDFDNFMDHVSAQVELVEVLDQAGDEVDGYDWEPTFYRARALMEPLGSSFRSYNEDADFD